MCTTRALRLMRKLKLLGRDAIEGVLVFKDCVSLGPVEFIQEHVPGFEGTTV